MKPEDCLLLAVSYNGVHIVACTCIFFCKEYCNSFCCCAAGHLTLSLISLSKSALKTENMGSQVGPQ